MLFFQKQLLFRSSFLKAGLTLLLAFGFLLFEIGGIKSSSIVVSREINIKGIFYTCLTKQLSAFLQLTAHSSFSTAHSPQQLFPTSTAQPNRASDACMHAYSIDSCSHGSGKWSSIHRSCMTHKAGISSLIVQST